MLPTAGRFDRPPLPIATKNLANQRIAAVSSGDLAATTPNPAANGGSAQPHANVRSGEPVEIPAKLSARIEPFDSYWQAPKDVEKDYRLFSQYTDTTSCPTSRRTGRPAFW